MNTIAIPVISGLDNALQQPDDNITNNGFFPDITLTEIRNAIRADGTITDERLKIAVIESIANVNSELKVLQEQTTYSQLANIPADTINGESILLSRYKRAVFCFAMANLYERYRSYDTTKEGAEKAEDFENSIGDLRRDGRFAIRDLLKINRWTVELI